MRVHSLARDVDAAGLLRWKVGLALLIVYAVWGTTHFATLIAVQSLPPVFMTGARFVVAGAVMLVLSGVSKAFSVSCREVLNCVVAGALMSFLSMTCAVVAISLGVASGLMSCIVATMPVWLTTFAHLGGEKVFPRAWIGVSLGVTGASLLFLDGNLSSTPAGALLALLSPIFWAAGSYWVRRSRMPPVGTASALQWLSGGLLGVIFGLATESTASTPLPSSLHASSWIAWGYLVVFGTLLTYTAYLWLVRNVSAPLAGSSSFVNPVIAVTIGGLFAGETLDKTSIVSLVLILCSLTLIIYKPAAAVGDAKA